MCITKTIDSITIPVYNKYQNIVNYSLKSLRTFKKLIGSVVQSMCRIVMFLNMQTISLLNKNYTLHIHYIITNINITLYLYLLYLSSTHRA